VRQVCEESWGELSSHWQRTTLAGAISLTRPVPFLLRRLKFSSPRSPCSDLLLSLPVEWALSLRPSSSVRLVAPCTTHWLTSPGRVDIGSNLGDPVFRGNYHGKKAHDGTSLLVGTDYHELLTLSRIDDFDHILKRARQAGVGMQLLTGDCLKGSKEVIALAKKDGDLSRVLHWRRGR
jgi:hypothetical protein